MSWLEDLNKERIYNYEFKDTSGEYAYGTLLKLSEASGINVSGEPGEVIVIDGREAVYAGFEPVKIKQEMQIEYEQNGRKAVHIVDKNGNHKYVSKTKLQYLKTGRADGVYTKAYEEHLKKTQQEHLIKEDRRQARFNVELAKSLKK